MDRKITSKKILIIDDEAHIAEALKLNLKLKGHLVEHAENGIEGVSKWKNFAPDLIVVDLMMPELDGHGVIEKVRELDQDLPILVLSAKDQVKEKVKCLSAGVDDYLAKPFHLDEFLARVERLLLKSDRLKEKILEQKIEKKDLYQFSDVVVDFNLFRASKKNEVIDLTQQELKLLKVFFDHPKMTLTREELLEKAWGYQPGVHSRTLDNFIVRFRRYFEDDPKNPKYFKSVRSVGYVFDREE